MEYLIRNVPYSIFHIVLNHVLGPSKAYQLTKTKSPTTTCLAHDSRGQQGDRAQPVIPGASRGSRAQLTVFAWPTCHSKAPWPRRP